MNKVLGFWLQAQAEKAFKSGEIETSASWCSAAAWFSSRKGWIGMLASGDLEELLQRLAARLDCGLALPENRQGKRCLHVFTEAYATLGHTNLCLRWIKSDSSMIHDVLIVDQRGGDVDAILKAAEDSGGRAVVLDASRPILERAAELRTTARRNADFVILHTHPEDVIASIAFGVPGGPPVVLVNHADHQFWVGCSIADLVLDLRQSGHVWTRECRGVARSMILPLPLTETSAEDLPATADLERKSRLRAQLGLPQNMTVLLTVGSAAKYDPIRGLDFVSMATQLMTRLPNACLVAVGPQDTGRWREARLATGGRIQALGRRPSAIPYCRAADVYLEGFPAGSLTAILEAAELGLACVRAPACCAPPFASDTPGLDVIGQPRDVEDYIQSVLALVNDETERRKLGGKLQNSIRLAHCGESWLHQLSQVKARIPAEHSIYRFHPVPVDAARRDWLTDYLHAKTRTVNRRSILISALVDAWERTTCKPQIDAVLWRDMGQASTGQADKTEAPSHWSDSLAVWWLNFRVRRVGLRRRLLANADFALRKGRRSTARGLTYGCLRNSLMSVFDWGWLKMLLKTHLRKEWIAGLQRYCSKTTC